MKKTYLNAETWSWEYDMPESSNRILVSCSMLKTNNPVKLNDTADYLTEVDGVDFYWNEEADQIFVYLPTLDGSKPTDKESGVYIKKEG